jgi:hypothetical protein
MLLDLHVSCSLPNKHYTPCGHLFVFLAPNRRVDIPNPHQVIKHLAYHDGQPSKSSGSSEFKHCSHRMWLSTEQHGAWAETVRWDQSGSPVNTTFWDGMADTIRNVPTEHVDGFTTYGRTVCFAHATPSPPGSLHPPSRILPRTKRPLSQV